MTRGSGVPPTSTHPPPHGVASPFCRTTMQVDPNVQSLVGREIIEFKTCEERRGRVWDVVGCIHCGGWRLRLEATAHDEDGDTLDGTVLIATLPAQDCFLFTRNSTTSIDVGRLKKGSRIFVEVGGVGHRRGTVVAVKKNKIRILYDYCERIVGGKERDISIKHVLFDISAAVQGRDFSYGPLFRKEESIETNQEVVGIKGFYRSQVRIKSIENELKQYFTSAHVPQKVDGQVRKCDSLIGSSLTHVSSQLG